MVAAGSYIAFHKHVFSLLKCFHIFTSNGGAFELDSLVIHASVELNALVIHSSVELDALVIHASLELGALDIDASVMGRQHF